MLFDRILSAERYSDARLVSQDGLFSFLSGKALAGVNVTKNTAMNLPVVYAAVGIIADAMAMLPLDVFRKEGEKRIAVENHPLTGLFNREPNPYMTGFTLRSTTKHHTLMWGNGYQEIERNGGGKPVSLWPLLPDATRPIKPAGDKGLYYQTVIDGKTFKIPKENVLHIPALGYDGYLGYSPIEVARHAIGLGLAMQEFGSKFFANDAKSGGFLLHPGKLGDAAKKNIKDSMEEQGGLDNAHRIKVLEEGMKFITTTIPPDDCQFLGSRQFQVEEIARIFRVPLVLLQSTEKSTSWGSGIESLLIGFVIWTLQPWVVRWEQEINRKLLSKEEQEKGYFVKFNLDSLSRGDMASRFAALQTAVGRPWMSPNEARAKNDMNPLPGLDEVSQPLNMSGANGARQETTQRPAAEPADEPPEEE